MNLKRLSDDALYEYLYQCNVDEVDIPRTRKSRIKLGKKVQGNFRINCVS